jgi:hypothetical protein
MTQQTILQDTADCSNGSGTVYGALRLLCEARHEAHDDPSGRRQLRGEVQLPPRVDAAGAVVDVVGRVDEEDQQRLQAGVQVLQGAGWRQESS